MKTKILLFTVWLFTFVTTLFAAGYVECFLSSYGTMRCFEFSKPLTESERLIWSDHYDDLDCPKL